MGHITKNSQSQPIKLKRFMRKRIKEFSPLRWDQKIRTQRRAFKRREFSLIWDHQQAWFINDRGLTSINARQVLEPRHRLNKTGWFIFWKTFRMWRRSWKDQSSSKRRFLKSRKSIEETWIGTWCRTMILPWWASFRNLRSPKWAHGCLLTRAMWGQKAGSVARARLVRTGQPRIEDRGRKIKSYFLNLETQRHI